MKWIKWIPTAISIGIEILKLVPAACAAIKSLFKKKEEEK